MATNQNIVIERVFNLPVSKVWAAWTEPELCKKWWGPKEYTCPYAEMDVRVGGKCHNCMRLKTTGEDTWSIGTYKEIILNKKLVMTDDFADKDGNIIPASEMNMPGDWSNQMIISVTLEEAGDGKTKMVLKHEGIPPESQQDCINGWNSSLDKIEENIK